MRLGIISLYAIIDFVVAIYRRDTADVSYIAHIGGSIAGFMVGIIILKNRKVEVWETRLKILCLVGFSVLMGIFVIWNLAGDAISVSANGYSYFPAPSEDKTNCDGKIII